MLMDYLRHFGLLLSTQLLLLMLLETKTICGDVPPHYWETPYSQPYFDNSSRREVTATVGQAALLHCRVRNLGDRAVSWIRKRDLHILTVGILTYTNDQRFQSLHTEGSDEWTLRISSPQPRDSGTYECQVSTEPKISQGFRLNVVVSRAKILGNAELFIKSGSDINLTCVAMQSPIPPSFIYWYKGKRVMNYSQRGGINVITERLTRTSHLLIAKATPADSGNYTCSPSSSVDKITFSGPWECAPANRVDRVVAQRGILDEVNYFVHFKIPHQLWCMSSTESIRRRCSTATAVPMVCPVQCMAFCTGYWEGRLRRRCSPPQPAELAGTGGTRSWRCCDYYRWRPPLTGALWLSACCFRGGSCGSTGGDRTAKLLSQATLYRGHS